MPAEKDIGKLWDKVVDRVKMKVIHPTLWRSLEAATPIAMEDGLFIVGFAPGSYHMSGHLTISEHRNAIQNALKEFSGTPLNLRVIEGDSLADWQAVKDKDERVQVLQDERYRKGQDAAAITKAWEDLFENAGRRYASTKLHGLPQMRAKYIVEMLKRLSDAIDQLMPEPPDELSERSLARVIERVGTMVEAPASMIALELMRYRAARKSGGA